MKMNEKIKGIVLSLVFILAIVGALGDKWNLSNPPPASAQQNLSVLPELTHILAYDGSNNLEYDCAASPFQAEYTWSIANARLTNVVDSSNTSTVTTAAAHGLLPGNSVTISGATVDTDLNGTYQIQTTPSSTTFTITTASVSDATYTDAAMKITSTAPRTTALIWYITKLTYSGSLNTRVQHSKVGVACTSPSSTTDWR